MFQPPAPPSFLSPPCVASVAWSALSPSLFSLLSCPASPWARVNIFRCLWTMIPRTKQPTPRGSFLATGRSQDQSLVGLTVPVGEEAEGGSFVLVASSPSVGGDVSGRPGGIREARRSRFRRLCRPQCVYGICLSLSVALSLCLSVSLSPCLCLSVFLCSCPVLCCPVPTFSDFLV